MSYRFPSDAWVHELKNKVNSSEAYRSAARTWEGDFYFICEAGPHVPNTTIMYMDLWHGECRAAYVVQTMDEKKPEFIISAPFPAWKKVINKQLDPIQALMTKQLKLKGNMLKIMKAVKAANELVNCCTLVDTEFPA